MDNFMQTQIRLINPEAHKSLLKNLQSRELTGIDSTDFEILYKEMPAPIGYEIHTNKETGKAFPYCCPMHTAAFNQAESWFEKFPNCCEEHKKLLNASWFNRDDYKGIPMKVVQQFSYTTHHILTNHTLNNWYEDVTDYIEASISSFGQLPAGHGSVLGLDIYMAYLKSWLQNNTKENLHKEAANKLLEYIASRNVETQKEIETDLNVLLSTYNKWLKLFPFNVSYFTKIKPYFVKHLPILKGKLHYNKYTGTSKAKVKTYLELIESLTNTTKQLLSKINTQELLQNGLIPDTTKHRIDLLNETHSIKQASLVGEYSSSEKRYITILKQWLKNESEYFNNFSALVREPPIKHEETKSNKLENVLAKYGIFNLPKTKGLSNTGKKQLITLISDNELPYAVAMFDYLGFLSHLEKEHFKSKFKLHKEVSKWFEKDKEGRAVKGNISVLLANSKEDRTRYTAHLHKENVQKDYQNLK